MKKTNINDLQAGMTLARTIINDNLIVVLAENTLLTTAHITRLKFLGIQDVHVKDAYDLSPQQNIVQAMLSRSHAFVGEYQEVLKVAENIFAATAKNKQVAADKNKSFIAKAIAPIVQESGIIDYLYELKHMNNSVYNHSLRVSILSGVLAKWLHYDKPKTQDVMLAGFLHDIGKTQIDKNIIEKNIENLTPAEYEVYVQHTLEGYHLLSENLDLSAGVKNAALQHHERMDSSGFPFNSRADEIHDYAKIVAIVDLYDNITTEREGFLKQTPFSAIAKITQEMFTTLDPTFCMPFLLNVQQSFIGSKVLLSDKRRGKIIQYSKDFAALPLVEMESKEILDMNRHPSLKVIEYNPS